MRAHRPWTTITLMTIALLWIPFASLLIGISGSGETLGLSVFLPAVLGLAGAVAAVLDGRLDMAARMGWAVTSVCVGLASVPLWWFAVTALWGP